jgi:hypothetical protein
MIWFGFMVFNATFNNISVISWRSVLLVEETGLMETGVWKTCCMNNIHPYYRGGHVRMQSVPITTDIVSLTPVQGEVYNIMW